MDALVRPRWCVIFIAILFSAGFRWAHADSKTFYSALDYQNRIRELEAQNQLAIKQRSEVLQARENLTRRLAENDLFLTELLGRQQFLALGLAQANVLANEGLNELNSSISNSPITPTSGMQTAEQARESIARALPSMALAQRVGNIQNQIDLGTQLLRNMDRAGRLGVERRVKILNELQSLESDFLSIQQRLVTQFSAYWSVADVFGERSNVELKAALRELEKSTDANEGARFAKAITLLRLGRYDEALQSLEELVNIAPLRAIVRSAQSEIYALRGQTKEMKVAMREALNLNSQDIRVHVHFGNAFAIAGDNKEAEREWELVLKSGQYDSLARRSLALTIVSNQVPSGKQLQRATEVSMVAAQLSPGDWMSILAQALVDDARLDRQGAIQKLEAAKDLAIDSNKVFCGKLLDAQGAGQGFRWSFKDLVTR